MLGRLLDLVISGATPLGRCTGKPQRCATAADGAALRVAEPPAFAMPQHQSGLVLIGAVPFCTKKPVRFQAIRPRLDPILQSNKRGWLTTRFAVCAKPARTSAFSSQTEIF